LSATVVFVSVAVPWLAIPAPFEAERSSALLSRTTLRSTVTLPRL
jgi:hypothetical protein